MKKIVMAMALCLMLPALCPAAGPEAVIVSEDAAALYFRERLDPGNPVILIPEGAKGFRWSVEGADVARVEFTPAKDPVPAARPESGKAGLQARLAAVEAALANFKSSPKQDLAAWQKTLLDTMPGLVRERDDLKRRLSLYPSGIPELPDIPMVMASFALTGARDPMIHYSYEMPGCGWTPVYDFAADLERKEIRAEMFAELRQFTGTDWKGADISFTYGGGGGRLPQIRPWYLEARKDAPQPRAMSLKAANGVAMLSDSVEVAQDAAPARARAVRASNEGAFASWHVPEKDIPQGLSLVKLASDKWDGSLEWVARPGLSGSSPAFMIARHDLAGDAVWPAGRASYGIVMPDGNVRGTGDGRFIPSKGMARLDFGPDRQVMVHVSQDLKRRGEKGLISASNVWSWGWTYTVGNTHDRMVRVRVERPQALAVDEGIKVRYSGEPRPETDAAEKMIFWDVDVPARGSARIAHQMEISAPQSMDFAPVPPSR